MSKVKDKERTVKVTREKAVTYLQGSQLSSDFSIETLQARRDSQEIFKVIKART